MNYPEHIYKKRLPELLAPAGSFEHMKAAILAGADAVYFGGTRFGARAYAENFDKDTVIRALDYVHFHGRRAYMTVNTLLKERELQEELYDYLLPYYEAGLDGVIVQDPGAASFLREHFPEMEIHGSTQMMITTVSGALTARDMGMNRVVPARELSCEEIRRMKEETGLEIEIFIHGALCYCYSGQCLFSSMYGGRSGNRGRCAQPCRLPYRARDVRGRSMCREARHLLSPRDLCSLDTLPSMIEAGVDSLKIEGRMKNVDYVAGVTSIYRKYLDLYASGQPYRVDPHDREILEELYSRSGFTDGYWLQHNGPQMMSIDTPRHLGRKLGRIEQIRKNRLLLSLNSPVSPRDLIVIPGGREEELVLTVPSSLDSILHKKGRQWELTLNAPKTPWLRPGLPVYRRHNEKLETWIREEILQKELRYPVDGSIDLKLGQPICLRLQCRGTEISIVGPQPMPAEKRPIREEDILRQMKKTGQVPYVLRDFQINMTEDLFLQASLLKEMRQQAYQALQDSCQASFHRAGGKVLSSETDKLSGERREEEPIRQGVTDSPVGDTSSDSVMQSEIIASVYDEEMLTYALTEDLFDGIVLSMDFLDPATLREGKTQIHASGKKAYLSLPHVYRQTSVDSLRACLAETCIQPDGQYEEKWDGIYINNINEFDVLDQTWYDVARIYAASFYQWNSAACQETDRLREMNRLKEINRLNKEQTIHHESKDRGRTYRELPYELSRKECLDLLHSLSQESNRPQWECLVYGRFPLMLSAQCIKKTLGQCNGNPEICSLTDRKDRQLPVSSHCHPYWIDEKLLASMRDKMTCYNMIWTDRPRDLIGEDLSQVCKDLARIRFDLFAVDRQRIKQAVERFKAWRRQGYLPSSDKKEEEAHWNYGIE